MDPATGLHERPGLGRLRHALADFGSRGRFDSDILRDRIANQLACCPPRAPKTKFVELRQRRKGCRGRHVNPASPMRGHSMQASGDCAAWISRVAATDGIVSRSIVLIAHVSDCSFASTSDSSIEISSCCQSASRRLKSASILSSVARASRSFSRLVIGRHPPPVPVGVSPNRSMNAGFDSAP